VTTNLQRLSSPLPIDILDSALRNAPRAKR
jgi:hypothetical protein